MAYAPQMGLLGDQQSLAPGLGLLGRLGNPGQDPIQAALAQMAAQRAQMAPEQGLPAPGPFAPPGAPSPSGGAPAEPQAPPKPPEGRPAPATRRPLVTPTQMGLFAAGAELASEDAPTLAHAVSRALAAGVPAFLTSKQAERDQADADALDRQWRESVEGMDITPSQKALLRSMPRDAGQKAAEGMVKQETTALNPGQVLVDSRGTEVARGLPKDETLTLGEGQLAFSKGADGAWNVVAQGGEKQTASPDAIEAGLFRLGLPAGTNPNTLSPPLREAVWQNAQDYRRSGGTNISVDARPSAERKMSETVASILEGERKSVMGALAVVPMYQRSLELLDQGITSGTLAPTRLGLSAALIQLGLIPAEADERERVRRTQEYLANTAQGVLAFVEQTGGGLRGLTEDERAWLTQARAGNISDRPEALRGILSSLATAAVKGARAYNSRVDSITEGYDPSVRMGFRVPEPEGDGTRPANAPLPPRNPGESWADYVKRVQ